MVSARLIFRSYAISDRGLSHLEDHPEICEGKLPRMKLNRYGRAAILTPAQISLLFTEGFITGLDKALFGVCLYAAARINEACTLLRGDFLA